MFKTVLSSLLACILCGTSALGADSPPTNYTAAQLIAAVKAGKPEGDVYIRLRIENQTAAGEKSILQVQVKRRTSADGGTEQLYQVLFPSTRKGDAVLLKVKQGKVSGAVFDHASGSKALDPNAMDQSVFGTALTVADLLARFLDWPVQETVGHEKIGPVACTVVESRSASGEKVRSWIDDTRYATMRVEVLDPATGKALKTIDSGKVVRGSSGYYLPASFKLTDHRTGATTEVEGVRSESGLKYQDSDFTEQAFQSVTGPPVKGA